jgi:ketosteroid isomerase-like protein
MSGMLRLLDRGYTMMWREGRVHEALIGLGDDFEWVVPRHPEGAVRHGAEGVIEFFREWIEPWEDFHLDWELREAGPGLALAIIDMRGVGRGGGVPAEMTFAQLWTYRDGRFVRMVMYYDVLEARRAAGLDPQ